MEYFPNYVQIYRVLLGTNVLKYIVNKVFWKIPEKCSSYSFRKGYINNLYGGSKIVIIMINVRIRVTAPETIFSI